MRRRTSRGRIVALVAAVAVAVPVLSGCSARLSQFIDVGPEGGGTLSLELRLDPAAQQAIDLPRQLQEGTFEKFLDVRNERWRAPGDGALPFQQRTEANGTVVLRSVRTLKAGTSQLDDLESALGVLRPLQPMPGLPEDGAAGGQQEHGIGQRSDAGLRYERQGLDCRPGTALHTSLLSKATRLSNNYVRTCLRFFYLQLRCCYCSPPC